MAEHDYICKVCGAPVNSSAPEHITQHCAQAAKPLADRIASALKAWAIYLPDGTPFHVIFSTQPPNKYLVGREYIKRVALVEIPEDEK